MLLLMGREGEETEIATMLEHKTPAYTNSIVLKTPLRDWIETRINYRSQCVYPSDELETITLLC